MFHSIETIELKYLETNEIFNFYANAYIRDNQQVIIVIDLRTAQQDREVKIKFSLYGDVCEFTTEDENLIIESIPGYKIINMNAQQKDTIEWIRLLQ